MCKQLHSSKKQNKIKNNKDNNKDNNNINKKNKHTNTLDITETQQIILEVKYIESLFLGKFVFTQKFSFTEYTNKQKMDICAQFALLRYNL